MDAILLNSLIGLPLLGAALVAVLPESNAGRAKTISLWLGFLLAAISLALWLRVDASTGPSTLVGLTDVAWVSFQGVAEIRYHVGLDAISGPLVALAGLLVPICVASSFTYIKKREREYYTWLLILVSGMFGVFAARDLILFYTFFELTLVPLYFLVGVWGGPDRRRAANMLFLYTFLGSVITFSGILYLAVRVAQLSGSDVVSFDMVTLSTFRSVPMNEQWWLFLALFCGFAIKVPFFPFHTWLPLAHTEAPTAGSVYLAAILLKLGTYGFLRFSLPMVPEGTLVWAPVMGWLAVAGIIYGALCSWVQTDVKKLVAYSSVSHLGFCMLGMFSLLPVGLSGSVLYMINHGLATGALFLIVGMIYERYHTRDMNEIGGLARRMPIMTFFLVLFTLSSVGLPGLNGFVSEFTTLLAAYNSAVLGPIFGVLGATGILLGAIYMLFMAGKVLFGPLREPPHTPHLEGDLRGDLNFREIAILTPLAVSCVVLGVYPRLVTDTLDPVLQREIVQRFPAARIAADGVAAAMTGDGASVVFGAGGVESSGAGRR